MDRNWLEKKHKSTDKKGDKPGRNKVLRNGFSKLEKRSWEGNK